MKIEPAVLLGFIERLKPFMDSEEQTFVHIELEEPDAPDAIEQLPVDAIEFDQWLRFKLVMNGLKELPTDKIVASVIAMVKGHAYPRARRDAELVSKKFLTKHPLVRAILALVNLGPIDANSASLMAQLNTIAQKLQINAGKGWPSSEDALGKQLVALKSKLTKLGLTISYQKNSRPRRWLICLQEQSSDPVHADPSDSEENEVTVPSDASAEPYVDPVTSMQKKDKSVSVSDGELNSIMKGGQT